MKSEGFKLKLKKEIEEKEVSNKLLLDKGSLKKMGFLSRKVGFVGGFGEDEKIVDMAMKFKEWRDI